MKRGFTLVELLTVVGLMAVLGAISTGGYFAFKRGMSDRGALAAATTLIAQAVTRAQTDLSPTVVYFYNELTKNKDDTTEDEAVYCGVAIAVRRAGRITRTQGQYLYDEFADLDRIYETEDANALDNGPGHRLYKFNLSSLKYSEVYDETATKYINGETFCLGKPTSGNFSTGDGESIGDIPASAFKKKADGNAGGWSVGDAYGYEFARVRLPPGYVFGAANQSLQRGQDVIVEVGTVIACYPDASGTTLQTVQISAQRGDGNYYTIGNTPSQVKDL